MKKEAQFWQSLPDGDVQCVLCPHNCKIKDGKRGICGTKENRNNKIIDLSYGNISAIAIDPIEKKPLAHFYPGSRALSVSSIGCNFTCPWCQNYGLSMSKIEEVQTRYMEPESVVEIALAQDCTSIAYTYNEPLINLNYLWDTAKFAQESEVLNVLVTNGYVSLPAFNKVIQYIDAANIDWKSFDPKFYKIHCGADISKVIDTTEAMHDNGIHIEITFLIIPETNDNPSEIKAMSEYIVENLGPDTPLHISRFFPSYKFAHINNTPLETLVNAKQIAEKVGLRYVFVGNVRGGGKEDTICPNCGHHVIKRRGYEITSWDLSDKMECVMCGEFIPIEGIRE